MITAFELKKMNKALDYAKSIVKSDAPKATFVFEGFDKDAVYFTVVAKIAEITPSQIASLYYKSPFYRISTHTRSIFKAKFKILIN